MDLIDALRLEPDTTAVVALVGGGGKTSLLRRLVQEATARGMRPIATTTTHLGTDQTADDPALVPVVGDGLPWAELSRTLDTHQRALVVGQATADRRPGLSPLQIEQLLVHAAPLGVRLIVVEADGSRQLPVKAPEAHEPVLPPCVTHLLPVIGVNAVGRRVAEGQVHRPARIAAVLGLREGDGARLTPAMAAALAGHPQGGAKACPSGAVLTPVVNRVERPHEAAIARLMAARWERAGLTGLITAAGRALETPAATPVVERWGPWGVVILAAGESRRMGRAKQLLPVKGEPMVHCAVRTALASGASQVVLVTGAYAEAVAAAVDDLAMADPRLRIVYNAAWESGQAGSLQTGLEALSPTIQVTVFLPADQPNVPVALLRRLITAWRQGAPLAAAAVDGVVRGVPALFDRSFWGALYAVRGDIGGRMVLQANLDRVARIPTPAAWLMDIDTPGDLP